MLNTVLSGDRPTGKLHLGHYVGSLQTRLHLQDQERDIKILIADTQVLNNDVSKGESVKENILQLMRAYHAIELNGSKVQFILQSEIPYIFELGTYLSNFISLNHTLRNPTLKAEQKMYGENMNMGFINYPIMQTADILIFKAYDVPVGEDQVPILEYGNDLIAKVNNNYKTKIFQEINPLISSTPRLMGIDGKNKMSKSLGNTIYLDATNEDITKKVKEMFTDPNHIKVSDPGRVEGNVVFMYLDIFHENKEEISELKAHYKKGGLGDMTLKKLLIEDLINFIEPIREKYQQFSNQDLKDRLMNDTEKAFQEARENMREYKNYIFK